MLSYPIRGSVVTWGCRKSILDNAVWRRDCWAILTGEVFENVISNMLNIEHNLLITMLNQGILIS